LVWKALKHHSHYGTLSELGEKGMRAVSVEALAGAIRAGDKVFVSGSAGEPIAVTELLATTPELAAGALRRCLTPLRCNTFAATT
jgi:hypothetical protein